MAEKVYIFAGFVGIGKTRLAEKYSRTFVDLDSSDYKWNYSKRLQNKHKEQRKGKHLFGKNLNTDYVSNYIDAILTKTKEGQNVLISCQSFCERHMSMLKKQVGDNVKIILIYPKKELKESYTRRLYARGNTKRFIRGIKNNWEHDIDLCIKNNAVDNHIVLNENQFLEDAIEQNFPVLRHKMNWENIDRKSSIFGKG